MCEDAVRTAESRDELLRRLRLGIPGLVINGSWAARLPGNLNVSIPGVPSHAVIARVRERLAISTGSACTSGIEAPSHVLVAMGLPRSVQESALRFGLGRTTTLTEVATAADLVVKAVADARDHL